MSRIPNPNALRRAAIQLFARDVEGTTDVEGIDCHLVAAWLSAQADAAEHRAAARKVGMPVGKVREHLIIAKKLQG
jgi:hypothetical protein